MATTKRTSPLLNSYRKLQSTKKRYCQGKVTAAAVDKAAKVYITRAEKAGQTKAEATRKANRVKKGGCSMTSSVAGAKRKTTTRKTTTRKTTASKRK